MNHNLFSKTIESVKFTPDQVRSYEDSLKYYRDLKNSLDTAKEEGKIEGMIEGKIEVALQMIAENEPIERITRFTGLSREEIQHLQQSNR